MVIALSQHNYRYELSFSVKKQGDQVVNIKS